MKLLLVDDEVITRRGLLESIDWAALSITEVLEADDGLQALELAKKEAPEIILTDMRMPHMDGVTFAARIRELLPSSSIIFMSGYSDKAYLQAAIRMRAVSYVEKPIDPQEVEQAVRDAMQQCEDQSRSQHYKHLQDREKFSRLALLLTSPVEPGSAAQEEILRLAGDLNLAIDARTWFSTVLVRISDAFSGAGDPALTAVLDRLKLLAEKKPFSFLFCLRADGVLLFQICARRTPANAPLEDFLHYLTRQLSADRRWMLAAGPFVQGPDRACLSFKSADALLETGFIQGWNTFLREDDRPPLGSSVLDEAVNSFNTVITSLDADQTLENAGKLYDCLRRAGTVSVRRVKDAYFKLFIAVDLAYRGQIAPEEDGVYPIWDRISNCWTLDELHHMLTDAIRRADRLSREQTPDSGPLGLMLEYIRKNYRSEDISVRSISSYAGLSAAYACTLFKSKTGQTMNQYLTTCRIDKARQLLADPRIKISEISAQVGYADGNYFGKSFKKVTGLTPSEYREKLLS